MFAKSGSKNRKKDLHYGTIAAGEAKQIVIVNYRDRRKLPILS